MTTKIKEIAILGGGTAGWLAANHLASTLQAEHDISITLIESAEIGIIGVGEGTVPLIRQSLQRFGISEADLLTSCDASFKTGIKFADWMSPDPARNKHGNFFYHPFASAFPDGLDANNFYLKHQANLSYSAMTVSVALSEAMKCPKRVSSAPYEGVVNYAYHFNAVKFGQLLANNARKRFAVKHKIATIQSAELAEDGSIAALLCADGERLQFDFYLDCSGFHALLLGQTMGIKFIDKSAQILNDRALTIQIPSAENAALAPYTLASAHSAGWTWDIPLPTRRGVGFVYSSDFLSDEQAHLGLARYLQQDPEQINPRKIQMQIGYRERFWHKNVVALGLAQGFVEPLEATAIFVTDFAARLFAENLSLDKTTMSLAADYYNHTLSYVWERVIDFVQLHYAISDRRDSEFWRANTEAAKLSETLQYRLALWRVHAPKQSDFFSHFDLFDVNNFLYVLYGMRYPTANKAISHYAEQAIAGKIRQVAAQAQQLQHELLDQRDWLNRFHQAYANAQSA